MSIRYIPIEHSYVENTYKNYKEAVLEEFVEMISSNDDSRSIFEIINPSRTSKMYFDIENIPFTEDGLIYKIVDELKKH